jgi:multisubunit Na+/H+ antiporter MnhF subunit
MIVALTILSLSIFLMLLGVIISKTFPEKVMSLCCATNYVIVLLCFLSLFEGRESFIDIAYIYGILGFIFNLSLLKLKGKTK